LGVRVSSHERQTTVLAGNLVRYHGLPALKRAGITKGVCFHTFRHTFGTLLNANGENPKVVQELLRHASLKVTTDVYMQAVSLQKREAQSNLVKLVRKSTAQERKPSLMDHIGS
jgi:integrase